MTETGAPTDYAALVAEAEALEEGVTEGPWKRHPAGVYNGHGVSPIGSWVEAPGRIYDGRLARVAEVIDWQGDKRQKADATFIAASRSLIPRLRQAVVDLVAENERLRKATRPPLPPKPRRGPIAFVGGPWDGEDYLAERVTAPVFAVGHPIGNHYWLDTKSDPPTYHWDGTEWTGAAAYRKALGRTPE